MKVHSDTVVTLSYELSLDDGRVVDSTREEGPVIYIHGSGAILPALERQLEGMEAGESRHFTLPASEGYGAVRQEMIFEIPRRELPMADMLRVGMRLSVRDREGRNLSAMVHRVSEQSIWMDGNHPLAGQNLHFAVKIEEVRKATPIELEQLRDS